MEVDPPGTDHAGAVPQPVRRDHRRRRRRPIHPDLPRSRTRTTACCAASRPVRPHAPRPRMAQALERNASRWPSLVATGSRSLGGPTRPCPRLRGGAPDPGARGRRGDCSGAAIMWGWITIIGRRPHQRLPPADPPSTNISTKGPAPGPFCCAPDGGRDPRLRPLRPGAAGQVDDVPGSNRSMKPSRAARRRSSPTVGVSRTSSPYAAMSSRPGGAVVGEPARSMHLPLPWRKLSSSGPTSWPMPRPRTSVPLRQRRPPRPIRRSTLPAEVDQYLPGVEACRWRAPAGSVRRRAPGLRSARSTSASIRSRRATQSAARAPATGSAGSALATSASKSGKSSRLLGRNVSRPAGRAARASAPGPGPMMAAPSVQPLWPRQPGLGAGAASSRGIEGRARTGPGRQAGPRRGSGGRDRGTPWRWEIPGDRRPRASPPPSGP